MLLRLTQGESSAASRGAEHVCPICGGPSFRRYRLPSLEVRRCDDCELAFLSSRPDEDALRLMYGPSYFDERQEYFAGQAEFAHEGCKTSATIQEFRHVLGLIEKFRGSGTLLDVGCATGAFLALARDAGFDVHGVELSRYAAQLASSRFGLRVIEGNLKQAGFPAESFQVVTMLDVFEHLPDPLDHLREVHRILCPGGILLINTPNEDALIRKVARLLYICSFGKFTGPAERFYHQYHLFSYSQTSMKRILSKCGFDITFIETKPMTGLKGRASPIARKALRAFARVEGLFGMQYELLVVANKQLQSAFR